MWNILREIQLCAMLTQGINMTFVRPLLPFHFFRKFLNVLISKSTAVYKLVPKV